MPLADVPHLAHPPWALMAKQTPLLHSLATCLPLVDDPHLAHPPWALISKHSPEVHNLATCTPVVCDPQRIHPPWALMWKHDDIVVQTFFIQQSSHQSNNLRHVCLKVFGIWEMTKDSNVRTRPNIQSRRFLERSCSLFPWRPPANGSAAYVVGCLAR